MDILSVGLGVVICLVAIYGLWYAVSRAAVCFIVIEALTKSIFRFSQGMSFFGLLLMGLALFVPVIGEFIVLGFLSVIIWDKIF